MSNNEWITNRLPNETDSEHCVWAWGVDDGMVKLFNQEDIVEGMAWQPVVVPPMPKLRGEEYERNETHAGLLADLLWIKNKQNKVPIGGCMGQRAILDKIMAKMEKSISTKNESQRRAAMSNWITDRRPTAEDAYKDAELVLYECVIVPGRDYKLFRKWYNVNSGEAWQCIDDTGTAITRSRWIASFSMQYQCWVLDQKLGGGFTILGALDKNDDQHREAAERIAAIYEEVCHER